MGLKLCKHSQDRQTAEDYSMLILLRVWQKSDPFYLNFTTTSYRQIANLPKGGDAKPWI
ncbi:hypothetical protein ANAEL_02505 [Anaerolineales bacterium]|nr:hypothetical protein ANAEL_02505 [Anaerolineales bacterium]